MAFFTVIERLFKPKTLRHKLQKREKALWNNGHTSFTTLSKSTDEASSSMPKSVRDTRPTTTIPEQMSNEDRTRPSQLDDDRRYPEYEQSSSKSSIEGFQTQLERVHQRHISDTVPPVQSALELRKVKVVDVESSRTPTKSCSSTPNCHTVKTSTPEESLANVSFYEDTASAPDCGSSIFLHSPNWVPLPPSHTGASSVADTLDGGPVTSINHKSDIAYLDTRAICRVVGTLPEDGSASGRCALAEECDQHTWLPYESSKSLNPTAMVEHHKNIVAYDQNTAEHVNHNSGVVAHGCKNRQLSANDTYSPTSVAPRQDESDSCKSLSVIVSGQARSEIDASLITTSHSILPPVPITQLLSSKKNGVADRMQCQINSLTQQLSEEKFMNAELEKASQKLSNALSTKMDEVARQQADMAELRTQLLQAVDMITELAAHNKKLAQSYAQLAEAADEEIAKVKAQNKELTHQNMIQSGQLYSTDYQYQMAKIMLRDSHIMVNQNHAVIDQNHQVVADLMARMS